MSGIKPPANAVAKAPDEYPLKRRFCGTSADKVREWLKEAGFIQHPRKPNREWYDNQKLLGQSEIWFHRCNTKSENGYATARLDLQGHSKFVWGNSPAVRKWTVAQYNLGYGPFEEGKPKHGQRIKRSLGEQGVTPEEVYKHYKPSVTQFYFEAVPHYHKEWVRDHDLEKYLKEFVPEIAQYDDDGRRVTGFPGDIAHLIHILR